jgi:hypothetical protein
MQNTVQAVRQLCPSTDGINSVSLHLILTTLNLVADSQIIFLVAANN